MTAERVVGYYVNHHGRGHLQRARAIERELDVPVRLLSSLDTGDAGVRLPLDEPADDPADVTAGGALHWAPLGSLGLSRRMTAIARWISEARPSAFVVDVSVEVALLARLCGVPTVVMAMPGARDDLPHELALRAATAVVAPWPRALYRPSWLRPYEHKTTYVGGISRHAGREARPASPRTVLVLGSAGGSGPTADQIASAARRTPGWTWRSAGAGSAGWVADPWALLCSAEVVVTAAGQNAVADIAHAGRAAVVVAQDRPFQEQHTTAGVLSRAGLAITSSGWPEDWPAMLQQAAALRTDRWAAWQTDGAARRAAAAITAVLR